MWLEHRNQQTVQCTTEEGDGLDFTAGHFKEFGF